MKKSAAPWLIVGGGIASLAAVFFAVRKSSETTDAIKDALAPVSPYAPARAPAQLNAVLTHYWPFKENLTAKERRMEGGVNDSNSQPLSTVEDFLSGKSDHVSIAGDDAIFPYGQKVLIPWAGKTLVGRITDTGGNFRGLNKVYRVEGREPLDVCVFSSANKPPNKRVTVTLVPGDDWASRKKRTGVKSIVASKFKDQTVVIGVEAVAEALVDAYYASLEEGL